MRRGLRAARRDRASAWRAGEISTGATRTIVAARVAEHDETLVACEPELLALARRGDLRSLRRAAAHFRNLALADGSEPRDRDGLHISQLYDGRTVISGELSNLGAETVVTALHAYVDPPSEGDTRTTSQRYAAALVRMAEVAITHLADDHRTPTQVSIVVDWATLTEGKLGRLDGEFTGPIHPQDIQRALCDSSISRVVTGPDSMPLDVGRTLRVPPAPMRRAVVARDQGLPVRRMQSTTRLVPSASHDLLDQRRRNQSQRPDPVLRPPPPRRAPTRLDRRVRRPRPPHHQTRRNRGHVTIEAEPGRRGHAGAASLWYAIGSSWRRDPSPKRAHGLRPARLRHAPSRDFDA